MTRLFYFKVAIRTAGEAVRIHTGAGYSAESKIQHYSPDAILYHTIERTTKIQELAISREIELQIAK